MVALPPALRLGAVHLTVADLDRAVAWYQRSLGLRVHRHEATEAELGDGTETVVVLHEERGRPARPARRPLPLRAALSRPGGAGPRGASGSPTRGRRSRARPTTARTRRSTCPTRTATASSSPPTARASAWPAGLGYDGGPAPLDVDALLATVAGEEPPPTQVGEGLRMGHLHLHVGDIDEALRFYRDVLGFEVQANLGSAAFVSAGGYHHHLGFNVWNGDGVGPAPEHTTGLRRWTVGSPAEDVAAVRGASRRQGPPSRTPTAASSSATRGRPRSCSDHERDHGAQLTRERRRGRGARASRCGEGAAA